MYVLPGDVKCNVCKRLFCCSKCRLKHELRAHAVEIKRPMATVIIAEFDEAGVPVESSQITQEITNATIYVFCPICENKPLALRGDIYIELLEHIESNHLPLHCLKCNKLYENIEDLRIFSKCIYLSNVCIAQTEYLLNLDGDSVADAYATHTLASQQAANVAHSTLSDGSKQQKGGLNESNQMTPISEINMRWKAKSKAMHEEFAGESVSFIKNLSNVSNSSLRRSICQQPTTTGIDKVIRSTSTPLLLDTVFAKPKEPVFNASGGHMSSIHNSGSELEHTPAQIHANGTPSAHVAENLHLHRKIGGRVKISAVTPLRQVMSKSIQKAFVEHGGMPSSNAQLCRNVFDLTDGYTPAARNAVGGGGVSPLDLRLSPALRRTQSGGQYCEQTNTGRKFLSRRKIRLSLSSQKLRTESIIITHTQRQVAGSVSTAASASMRSSRIKAADGDGSSFSNGAISTSTSSVYKSCESFEIITATAELSAIEEHSNVTSDKGGAAVVEMNVDNLNPLTPITRIPGAMINKKAIKFETPLKEKVESANTNASACVAATPNNVSKSPEEKFYTPSANLPVQKLNANSSSGRKKSAKRRSDRRFLLPQPRPPLRERMRRTVFSNLEEIAPDNNDISVPQMDSTKHKQENSQQQSKGRLWSLVSSVMRLPSFKYKGDATDKLKTDSTCFETDINSNSVLKRCASIAGSLVRSKPILNEEQIESLKRKRTHTLDNQTCLPTQINFSDALSPRSTSKRFRIHARKPIGRMHSN